MKVQFLQSVGGIGFNYGRGGWYDTLLPSNAETFITESDANYYISKGIAKAVEEDNKPPVKPEVRPLKDPVKKPVKKKPKSKSKKVSTRPVK